MKPNIVRGSGFRGLADYLLDKPEGKCEVLDGNVVGDNARDIARQFAQVRKLRPDISRPVLHASLSLPKGEHLSREKWNEVCRDFMTEIGMDPDNHPHLLVRHGDTPHEHVHIETSRIGLDSTVWHGQWEGRLAQEACRKIEIKHGLQVTYSDDPTAGDEPVPGKLKMSSSEFGMWERKGELPPKMLVAAAVDRAIDAGDGTPEDLRARLGEAGIEARISVGKGRVTGISYALDHAGERCAMKGGQVGKAYEAKAIQSRLEARQNALANAATATSTATATAAQSALPPAGPAAPRPGAGSAPQVPGVGGSMMTRPVVASVPVKPDPLHPSNRSSLAARVDASPNLSPVGEGSLLAARVGALVRSVQRETRNVENPGKDAGGTGSGGRQDPRVGQSGDGRADRRDPPAVPGDDRGTPAGDWSASVGSPDVAPAPGDPEPPAPAAKPAAGGGGRSAWNSKFKQASAQRKRDRVGQHAEAGERADAAADGRLVVASQGGNGRREFSQEELNQARATSPEQMLRHRYGNGISVTKGGRHISVEGVLRADLKDGRWVSCDWKGGAIGDNISLARWTGDAMSFPEAVRTVLNQPEPQPGAAAPMRQAETWPAVPRETVADRAAGRAYLEKRGISAESIKAGEAAGLVGYTRNGVLFKGMDETGKVRAATIRHIEPVPDPKKPDELLTKRDLAGTDKTFPGILPGSPKSLHLVEGGVDALALRDRALRAGRLPPTIMVTGGAAVRRWIENSKVVGMLKAAIRIVIHAEHEKDQATQQRNDARHEAQRDAIAGVRDGVLDGIEIEKPNFGKDQAEFNLHEQGKLDKKEEAKVTEQRSGQGIIGRNIRKNDDFSKMMDDMEQESSAASQSNFDRAAHSHQQAQRDQAEFQNDPNAMRFGLAAGPKPPGSKTGDDSNGSSGK